MRKILTAVVALSLLVGGAIAFTACDGGNDQESATASESVAYENSSESSSVEVSENSTTENVIPEGYQLYSNGYVAFAYPLGWGKTDGSVVILNSATSTNNITVSYEPKSDIYLTMTTESFATDLKPILEEVGMKITNESVTQKSKGDLAITEISYTATIETISMDQTQFCVQAGEYCYFVTITEVTPDQELIDTVYNTLKVLA